jgi:cold-inducible RNA-binding protein
MKASLLAFVNYPRLLPAAPLPSVPVGYRAVWQRQSRKKRNNTVTNIFVGNLSYKTTQDELHTAFAQYGGVERVNIVTDRDSGQSRGFAFVEMRDASEAQAAISHLNGTEMNGRVLNVNEARPKPAGEGGGGGFGGRREGRGAGGGGGRGGRGGGGGGQRG